MTDRKSNLHHVKELIANTAKDCGRDPAEIKLLAVSKVFGHEDIKEVYNLGQVDFGESRAQELRDKLPQLPDDINWHFIGPLQTNKIKYVIPNSKLIHAVDSFKLARAIAEYGSKINVIPDILIEVNTSGEEAKHGFSREKAVELCLELNEIQNLNIQGLMTMASYSDDVKIVSACFASLRNVQEDIQKHLGRSKFKTLSMGMSSDYEVAIKEGSTIVRVGTAIFGPRRR